MTNPSNLRARIAAGEELVMLRGDIGWSTEQLAAAWAGGTYDFIWLDSQHSPYSDHHLVSFSASAEQLGIPVQLRIPHTREAHKVGRFFDLGITGALVPEVMEASTVQDAIDFAYYGPIGRRSWGGVNRLGLRNHAAPTARRAYADWWNTTVLLSIQIESVETVRNIARLVRPEITHVTWGPNDLSFRWRSMPIQRSTASRRACGTWPSNWRARAFACRWARPRCPRSGRPFATSASRSFRRRREPYAGGTLEFDAHAREGLGPLGLAGEQVFVGFRTPGGRWHDARLDQVIAVEVGFDLLLRSQGDR